MNNTTMNDIAVGQLFILDGVGVLRKTHPCQGTQRGKEDAPRVVYPNDPVIRYTHKGK